MSAENILVFELPLTINIEKPLPHLHANLTQNEYHCYKLGLQ